MSDNDGRTVGNNGHGWDGAGEGVGEGRPHLSFETDSERKVCFKESSPPKDKLS